MDNRKWQSGASSTPPTPPAAPSAGYPTNGGVATPVTTPGEWWYHQIGEELRGVIVAAGLSPAHGQTNQLLQALSDGWLPKSSLSTSGYCTLPGGLILQWGGVATTTGGATLEQLPVPWPNLYLWGSANYLGTNVSNIGLIGPSVGQTTTHVSLAIRDSVTGAYGATANLRYLVLGY